MDRLPARPIATPLKVAWHEERVARFLSGEDVAPVTIELDLTTECDANCRACPSTRGPKARRLPMASVERLFASVAGQTRGLLLSGGEPTLAETFPAALAAARRHGFEDLTVVTNGSRLGLTSVQDALLEHGSAVRISIYGWDDGPDERMRAVLSAVAGLRTRIDACRSGLEIGFSLLTSTGTAARLESAARTLARAGAHWLYLHPRCSGWGTGELAREPQAGILDGASSCGRGSLGLELLVCPERYAASPVAFTQYHASHFLLVVGADGLIYLGTETKYQPACVVGALGDAWDRADLWRPERRQAIARASSATYAATGGRHRGILYSHLIQEIMDGRLALSAAARAAREAQPRNPHVL